MENVVALLVVIFAVVIFNGFRTRCPSCGQVSIHPKVPVDKEVEKMMRQIGDGRYADSFATRRLRCKKCGQLFSRDEALAWGRIERTYGNEKAIEFYRAENRSKSTD
jgi:hypothetical protein